MKYRKVFLTLILSIVLIIPNLGISATNTLSQTTDLDISKNIENRDEKHNYNVVFIFLARYC